VTAGHHCATCGIDFEVNFDRSVEVAFRPNPAVRHVEGLEYCVGGPGMTPHVVVQQLLGAGEARAVRPRLEEGRYRLRAFGLPGGQSLRVVRSGDAEISLGPTDAGWPVGERLIGTEPTLRIENATQEERLVILERTTWSDQAATAAEVTALQLFRDLFAEEALRPGEQISVGSLTLLFTDLRGSTQLYRQVGDAVAFGAVMTHFDVLRECIADEGGAIVKTLGDAVMGAFTRPAHALRAALRAQELLASPPSGLRPLALKAGIHTGPCIAVTLNGRLDYFGSNVNIAARLEPLSTGRDCIISGAVRDDPRIASLLSGDDSRLTAEPISTTLKGFDAEHFDLWRVTRKEASPTKTGTQPPQLVI
jgi:class 3 adenylate cyclase